MAIDIDSLLRFGTEAGASDIFLKDGAPPALRMHGSIRKLDQALVTSEEIDALAKTMMRPEEWDRFHQHPDHDLSYSIPGVARFRVNVYKQRGSIAIVLRIISLEIRQIGELGLPEVVGEFTRHHSGLVLVTGPTGSGKTTTLAAMLDLINQEKRGHIVTIEDPIEYVHTDKKSIVSQREIGIDTKRFSDALRASLREAPDVILVGELRDQETMGICLQAAETGHLVFSTLHTASAAESMERMLAMFQPHEKALVQTRLSKTLKGIVSQTLVPTADGKSRACAVEVLNVSPTVVQYIDEGRSGQIYQAIKEGTTQWKMQTMNMSLDKLCKEGKISEKDAMEYSTIRSELRQMLRRTSE